MLVAIGVAAAWRVAPVWSPCGAAAVLQAPHTVLPPSHAVPVESRRGALTGIAVMLTTAASEPALALTDGALQGVAGFLGVDAGNLKEFSTDLVAANDARVKIRFNTFWPVRKDVDGVPRVGYVAQRSNQFPGESGFVQGVKRIGVKSVADLSTKQLLDAIFTSNGPIGEVAEPKLAAKPKTITGLGGQTYTVLSVRFKKISASGGLEVESRASLSAAVVAGDLFIYVMTCREATWDKSQARLTPSAESFQASLM